MEIQNINFSFATKGNCFFFNNFQSLNLNLKSEFSYYVMFKVIHTVSLCIRVGWFFIFFLNITKNNAIKVVYIPIKYSYQKFDLNLSRFFANLAWKILNKYVLKNSRFCQIWPKYWCKNQTISVFKLGNLILFYGNIINKL